MAHSLSLIENTEEVGDICDLRHCAFPRSIALISLHRRHGRCSSFLNLGSLNGDPIFLAGMAEKLQKVMVELEISIGPATIVCLLRRRYRFDLAFLPKCTASEIRPDRRAFSVLGVIG
jgi:hypothetical protein